MEESLRSAAPEPAARTLELEVDGAPLEAIWLGPGAGQAPTLVFLHEGLGCVALWRDFPARLAEVTGCGALLYSRRGYGGSAAGALPRGTDFLHEEAEVLPAVLAAAGVREYVLVGHSDGGSIALIHAATRPRGLLGLVTEAAHVFVEDETLAAIRAARERFEHGDLRERLARYHGDNVDRAFEAWCGPWLDPAFAAWNIEALLPRIAEPALIIQGAADPYGTEAQVRALAGALAGPVQTLIVPGCGHAPHEAEPEAVLAATAGFVNRLVHHSTSTR